VIQTHCHAPSPAVWAIDVHDPPSCTPSPGWLADHRCGAELGILRVQGRWMLAS
jgi:hypothetical protein